MITYKDILRYLNSEMPEIGGIFQPPTSTTTPNETTEQTTNPTAQILTPEQLLLLQQQQKLGLSDNSSDDTNVIDRTNNMGINGFQGALTALGFMFNPVGTMMGLGLKSKYDDFKNTGSFFDRNLNNISREIGEGSTYGTDIDVANLAQARGITKQLLQDVPLGDPKGPNERDQGPGETTGGTFGSSTNDSGFSDYS